MSESFEQWIAREIPPGTVISDPLWWAPKIRKALQSGEAVVPEGHALVTINDLKTLQFYLEPYDDIKPRDWVTDRKNLRIAHQLLQALLSAGKGGE